MRFFHRRAPAEATPGADTTDDASGHAKSGPDMDASGRDYTLARLDAQIDWYERHAGRNNLGHKACMVVSISTAAAISVLAAASFEPLFIAAMGAVIVIAQGLQELYQFQSNWVTFARTKELLRRERSLYHARAGPYARTKDPDPDRLLAERTEAVAAMELDAWVDSQRSEHKK